MAHHDGAAPAVWNEMLILRVWSSEYRQIARFLAVGALTALIYFGLLALLLEGINLNYRYAVSIAYFCGVAFHFLSNRQFTFRSHDHGLPGQILKYCAMVGINYAITIAVVDVIVRLLHFSPYVGAACAIGITVVTGYLLARFWVFRPSSVGANGASRVNR